MRNDSGSFLQGESINVDVPHSLPGNVNREKIGTALHFLHASLAVERDKSHINEGVHVVELVLATVVYKAVADLFVKLFLEFPLYFWIVKEVEDAPSHGIRRRLLASHPEVVAHVL